MLLPANVERQSLCELEVDVVAADILNRREVAGQWCHSCQFSLIVNESVGFGECVWDFDLVNACEREVDEVAADILNRQEVTGQQCHSRPFSLIVNDSVGFGVNWRWTKW